jgi:FkbM family methyltransferase
MNNARYFELSHHLPKLQLLEVFPLVPFLWLRGGMVSIDIGANTGLWSEAYLRNFGARTARHIMVEPMPANAERLRRRSDNVLKKLCAGVEIREAAMGDNAGDVVIHFDSDVTTLASVRSASSDLGHTVVNLSRSITVPQLRLDDEIARLGVEQVDFIKVDVEGYEQAVFDGSAAAIADGRIRNILFEFGVHQTVHGETLAGYFDFFRRHGYRMYRSHRARNFFGLTEIAPYTPAHEPTGSGVEMLLVTLDGPDPRYSGPRVVTRQPVPPA